MQIHELPAGTPAAGMTFAGDTGAQTQKIDYGALADAILNKLTTKNFDIKSESQTIIAALNSLGDASKQGVANNLVTTGAGYVLDARQGKALSDLHAANADAIAALNSSTESFAIRSVSIPYTVAATNTFNTNLMTYINADIPTGYTCLGVVGSTTNSIYVYFSALYASSTNYSFQIRNTGSSSASETARVWYLCYKKP